MNLRCPGEEQPGPPAIIIRSAGFFLIDCIALQVNISFGSTILKPITGAPVWRTPFRIRSISPHQRSNNSVTIFALRQLWSFFISHNFLCLRRTVWYNLMFRSKIFVLNRHCYSVVSKYARPSGGLMTPHGGQMASAISGLFSAIITAGLLTSCEFPDYAYNYHTFSGIQLYWNSGLFCYGSWRCGESNYIYWNARFVKMNCRKCCPSWFAHRDNKGQPARLP